MHILQTLSTLLPYWNNTNQCLTLKLFPSVQKHNSRWLSSQSFSKHCAIDAYIESARAQNQVWTNNRELLICLLQQLWPVRVWRRQPFIKQLYPGTNGLTSPPKDVECIATSVHFNICKHTFPHFEGLKLPNIWYNLRKSATFSWQKIAFTFKPPATHYNPGLI